MIENVTSINSAQQIGSIKPAYMKTNELEKVAENRDEYVPSEEKESIGLYSISPDENGEPQISFDGENAFDKQADIPEAVPKDTPEKETTTANTDSVDSEIKALRNKKQALDRQLRSADENTADDLRSELEQVSAELAQKDNDEYRRQNTVFT